MSDAEFLDELERDLDKPVVVASASEDEVPAEDDASVPLEEQVARLRKENYELMKLLSRTNEEAESEKQRMTEDFEREIAELKKSHAQEVADLQQQMQEVRDLGVEMAKKAEGEAAAATKSAEMISSLQAELHTTKNKLREETEKLAKQVQLNEKLQSELEQAKRRQSPPKEAAPKVPEKSDQRAGAAPVAASETATSSPTATSAPAASSSPSKPAATDSPADRPKPGKLQTATPGSPVAGKKDTSSPMSTNPNACLVCGKTVYPMDKLSIDGRTLHKVCFRCSHCNSKLSNTNFCFYKEKAYCKTHFMQLFKLKGSYNDLE